MGIFKLIKKILYRYAKHQMRENLLVCECGKSQCECNTCDCTECTCGAK